MNTPHTRSWPALFPTPWGSGSGGTCLGNASGWGWRVPPWGPWRSTSISPSCMAFLMSRPTDTSGEWIPHLFARIAGSLWDHHPLLHQLDLCSLAPASLHGHHHHRSGPHGRALNRGYSYRSTGQNINSPNINELQINCSIDQRKPVDV